MDLIQALKNIGFTQQEAIIYIALCKEGPLSGYEAAKITGISRSNVYSALATLVDKGGAYIIEESTKKYIAVTKKDLLKSVVRDFEENISYLEEHLHFSNVSHEPYITITGEKNLFNKIKNILLLAERRIYISAVAEEIKLFEDEIKEASSNGLKIVLITNDNPCEFSQLDLNTITFYKAKNIPDSFKMIVDTNEVLTAKLIPYYQALYSKNKTLVNLMREAFINEIELIKIRDNHGLKEE